MNCSPRTWRARNVLVEAAGLAFVFAGIAIGTLPQRLRENVELPAAIFVLVGAAIWIQVLKAAARSRSELSSSLESEGRAQQELAWSEDRLHFTQEVARMGTWDTDLATGEGIWSDGLRDTWGIDASVEPTYENFIALVHPDDRRRVEEIVLPAERDGGDFEYEYRVCRPDGEIPSCTATCSFRIPSASRRRTSRSRLVRDSRRSVACGPARSPASAGST